jgi:hypothetical protein
MFTDSRLLPASGAFPTPGQDVSGTLWQQYMRPGEIALFTFDARTGQPLTAKCEVPQMPICEYCSAFRSMHWARLVAKGRVRSHPHVITVLYDKRGRWLATMSREGEERRNPGLGLAWILFQFPLWGSFGMLVIFAVSALFARWFGTEPLLWEHLSPQEWNGLMIAGLLLAGVGKLVFELGRRKLILRLTRAARQPVGSPERETFYTQLARSNPQNLLVPLDITFTPTTVDWHSPEKYAAWTDLLRREGFLQLGTYVMPEAQVLADFWFHPEEELTATIPQHPKAGMWLSIFTRYEDWSSFCVANKKEVPIDPHPTKKVVYLGPEVSGETVLEQARRDRPRGVRRRPTRENILSDYATSWRQYVEWRRTRGTTAEEYKRVAESKAHAKAAGTSWL